MKYYLHILFDRSQSRIFPTLKTTRNFYTVAGVCQTNGQSSSDIVSDIWTIKMTISQAAYHFNVSDRTIRRWIESGKLKAHKTEGQWQIEVFDVCQTNEQPVSDTVSNLKKQLAEQKSQISHLQKQTAIKDEQIANLQKSTEGLQQSLDQAQQLHAMSEQRDIRPN